MTLSSLEGAMDPLEVGVGVVWLFNERVSTVSGSPLLEAVPLFSFAAPLTAPLNLLYNPLSPFCTSSVAIPLVSVAPDGGGGEANSLKVVRESEWLAVL